MDKLLDQFLARQIKKWVSGCKPPVGGRARLIREAAHIEARRHAYFLSPYPRDIILLDLPTRTSEVSNRLFNWMVIYTFDNGISNSRLII